MEQQTVGATSATQPPRSFMQKWRRVFLVGLLGLFSIVLFVMLVMSISYFLGPIALLFIFGPGLVMAYFSESETPAEFWAEVLMPIFLGFLFLVIVMGWQEGNILHGLEFAVFLFMVTGWIIPPVILAGYIIGKSIKKIYRQRKKHYRPIIIEPKENLVSATNLDSNVNLDASMSTSAHVVNNRVREQFQPSAPAEQPDHPISPRHPQI